MTLSATLIMLTCSASAPCPLACRGYGFDKHVHTLHAVRQLGMRLVAHPDAFLVHMPHPHSAAQALSRQTGQVGKAARHAGGWLAFMRITLAAPAPLPVPPLPSCALPLTHLALCFPAWHTTCSAPGCTTCFWTPAARF